MNAAEILDWINIDSSSKSNLDWVKIRHEIVERYSHALENERITLLKVYATVMDAVERQTIDADLETDLEKFREARRQDYNLMLISECVATNGNVSPQALKLVTQREVEAGRMSPDDELRKLAVGGPEAFPRNADLAVSLPATSRWRKAIGWLGRRK